MSRFPQGLSVYTITKGRKIEEPLPPLKRTFGCLALQQFPKSPTEFFRPDWMDEEEEAALEAASKKAEEERNIDLLYF
ncbi:hypothetical protein QFC19_006786 [Naganishia cerealis]|uniref:Uncharacterized protein n=1 Tax=Naganishia cerealis TaxID=610337 RepID=A0ACC2VEC0_9TREE|nr:hypothetical protein QFC19_006786 [Naganishia cerealis]